MVWHVFTINEIKIKFKPFQLSKIGILILQLKTKKSKKSIAGNPTHGALITCLLSVHSWRSTTPPLPHYILNYLKGLNRHIFHVCGKFGDFGFNKFDT